MPELPEVETIVRVLRPCLVGKTILKAELLWPRALAMPSPAEFTRRIKGQRIIDLTRRAKFLHLHLSNDHLLIHLRMSGALLVKENTYRSAKHDRLILTLSDASFFVFNDPRKFGRVWLVEDPQRVFSELGPEPLDAGFTPQMLFERLRARRRQLKPLLLDQTFIAGLGNIYTDEVLHLAKLHPLTLSNLVTVDQVECLWRAMREVLEEGIQCNGASIDWVYRGGEFQYLFRVYGRDGEPCLVCGTPIERIVIGQRGTHFCPTCQSYRS